MTITIQLNELKDYQNKLHAWVNETLRREQVQHLITQTQNVPGPEGLGQWLLTEFKRADEYLKTNAMPKLIPDV